MKCFVGPKCKLFSVISNTTMAVDQKSARLVCMLVLTLGFFVVEVVVSRLTASLAMLSDSFHMLSDVIALFVGLLAARFADQTWATSQNTYGWIRAEVMGAMVNAVFLTALCFTILLEAAERFTEPHEIEKPRMVLWVGVTGFALNVMGLVLFHGYAGHRHSHSGKQHQKSEVSPKKELLVKGRCDRAAQIGTDIVSRHTLDFPLNGNISLEELAHGSESSSQLNMRGVFLHVLGDALGSFSVVLNALIFMTVWKPCDIKEICINPCHSIYWSHHGLRTADEVSLSSNSTSVSVAGPCWVLYLDPTLCLIMVAILLYTAFPLLKESAHILLQSVPKQIDIQRLTMKLRSLDGVLAIHELHIWQLAGSRIIATAHVKCHDPASYMDIAKRIKSIFHDEGIHATTVQPEFSTDGKEPSVLECELPCYRQCNLKLCCEPNFKSGSETDSLMHRENSSCRNALQHHTVTWNLPPKTQVYQQTEMESSV